MLDHAKEAIQDCPSKKNKEDDDKESKKGNQDVENDMEWDHRMRRWTWEGEFRC